MFRGMIFDLDGTLLDSLEDLAESMNTVLCKVGFPTHDIEKYKYFVGDGMENLVLRALPQQNIGEGIVSKCMALMKEEYGNRLTNKTRPYDGIQEVLDELAHRGIKMAVLSNKPDEMIKLIVKRLLPGRHFAAVFGQRNGIPKKPDPCAALEIANFLGIKPDDFLYVGDTNTDMETANAAGMFAVGVLWGFREEEELLESGARALIKKPLDILKLLKYEYIFSNRKNYSNSCMPSFS
jgi:phosphoglycolate phosphatase